MAGYSDHYGHKGKGEAAMMPHAGGARGAPMRQAAGKGKGGMGPSPRPHGRPHGGQTPAPRGGTRGC